jgi:hypothetical protein
MGFEADAVRGVNSHYGPRAVEEKYGGTYTSKDQTNIATWIFDATDLPAGSTTNSEMSIPANATIIAASLEIITAVVSTSTTTDLLVGLEQADGTDIDLDGFVTAAQATQTAILVEGDRIVGSGALVGSTIGTAAGELSVTSSAADLLSGKCRVVVEYIL